jgi:hypothetical protein
MKRISARIRARRKGSAGTKVRPPGKTSSRYSMITEESITGVPSWSSVGTRPFGLSFR